MQAESLYPVISGSIQAQGFCQLPKSKVLSRWPVCFYIDTGARMRLISHTHPSLHPDSLDSKVPRYNNITCSAAGRVTSSVPINRMLYIVCARHGSMVAQSAAYGCKPGDGTSINIRIWAKPCRLDIR